MKLKSQTVEDWKYHFIKYNEQAYSLSVKVDAFALYIPIYYILYEKHLEIIRSFMCHKVLHLMCIWKYFDESRM